MSKTPNSEAITTAINTLHKAISSIAIDDLKMIIANRYASKLSIYQEDPDQEDPADERSFCLSDLAILEEQAGEAIQDLIEMAELGFRDSIKSLASLGVKIAMCLEGLLHHAGEGARDERKPPQQARPTTGDAGTDSQAQASASGEVKPRPVPNSIFSGGQEEFVSTIQILAGNEGVASEEVTSLTHELMTKHRGESSVIFLDDLIQHFAGDNPVLLKTSIMGETLPDYSRIEWLVQLIVAMRVAKNARKNTLAVAAELAWWPICFSAIGDQRLAGIARAVEEVNLGANLSIRVNQQPGRGQTRYFEAGSSLSLATHVYWDIEWERNREKNPRLRLKSKVDWKRKAERLPPLSQEGRVIKRWVAVAMAYLKLDCGGDFKACGWPESIEKRAARDTEDYSNSRLQTTLRESLTENFKQLAK